MHDEAEDEQEPGVVLAVMFGAHSVPVGATGTLQALGDEPVKGPEAHPPDKRLHAVGAHHKNGGGAEIPGSRSHI